MSNDAQRLCVRGCSVAALQSECRVKQKHVCNFGHEMVYGPRETKHNMRGGVVGSGGVKGSSSEGWINRQEDEVIRAGCMRVMV